MVFQELESSLTNGIMPIYQIYGKDAFLLETALKLLKNYLVEPDLNLSNFLGADVSVNPENFINAVKSFPFLADKRFIIVKDYYPTAKELSSKKLSYIFDNPEETSVIIIVNDKKCEALFKHKNVVSVDCDKAETSYVIKWIKKEALKNKVSILDNACEAIIEYTSQDMSKINGEIQKLVSFVGENNEITLSDVDKVVSKDVEYEIYEFTSFIADLKYDKALAVLKDMLNKNQDKQRLFISMYYHFRRLLHASISNASERELSVALGVKEYAIKKAKIQAKKFTPKKLKEICDKLSRYDSLFKRGDVSVDTALWNSIFNAII